MAQQTINVGTAPNDGTGTPLRTAFQYTNSNFSELYTAVGPSGNNIVVPGSATITGDLTVDTSTLKVDSANNRVGIGTATPGAGYSLDILGAAVGGIRVSSNNYPNLVVDSANSNGALIYIQEGGTTQARIGHLTAVTGLEFSGNNGTAATNVHYGIDSTGISTWKNVGGVAGTAMTLNATGLGVGGVPSGTNRFLILNGATQALTLTTSGDLFLGAGISGARLAIRDAGSNDSYFGIGANNDIYLSTGASGVHYFRKAAGAASMTLDASGTLLVGTTSAGASGFRCYLSTDSGTTKWSVGPYVSATNFAIVASGSAGGVYLNGTTATSWTALSDERFKDIIEPISNAVAKVGSLRAVIGKIKGDETNTRKSFLIAQDVESVLPEAVDASNPDRLGLAYTDVIPLLVAAIKELTARVQTLETR